MIGDRVQVHDRRGTSFGKAKGVIVSECRTRDEDGFMVLLDGERLPLYFGPAALFRIADEPQSMVAGE